MINIKNLNKTYRSPIKTGNTIRNFFNREYKSSIALKDISFNIDKNELVGFIGPNGAGKTTTMKILAGILYPTSGEVSVFGYKPFQKNPKYLKQMAFLMGQKNQLLWELPATDAYKLNKEIYELSDTEYNKTLTELSELLEVKDFISQPVKTLSLGQRMRAELIGALLHKPKVLFLDEPTIGLDIFAQTTIVKFIKEYQDRYGATIMLTSHYMQDVQRLAKRVILINRGEIMYDGKLQHLIQTYSKIKKVSIILSKEINPEKLKLQKNIIYQYQHPQLKISILKDDIEKVLRYILKEVDYIDMTIENESLEEIIKKSFNNI
ncbi:MAG TPA: ATP-binding cassette domain-containing protein [Candidatus Woesebacteria bacterium]|nr:ATP-binding cassette domain-containing protein [Candidatus Woesebacteria bacterium]